MIQIRYPFIKGERDIFTATIAKMFSKFMENVVGMDVNEKQEFITLFSRVFDDIKILNGYKDENFNSLEELVAKSEACNIDKHFTKLFEKTGYSVEFLISELYVLSDLEFRDIARINQYQNKL